MLYEIAVLVLICGVAGLGLYVSKLRMDVRILREEVKVLSREMTSAFWKEMESGTDKEGETTDAAG